MAKNLLPGHLYGEKLKTREVTGFQLSEIAYGPGDIVPSHSHELAQFCLVREGTFSEVYGRKTRDAKPLMLILRPSGETHAHHFHNTGSRCFVIEIENDWLNRLREHRGVLDDSAQFSGGLSVWLAMRLYNEFQRMDEASSLAIEGLMFEIIAEASRQAVKVSLRKPPSWVKHAEEFLKANFFDTLTLDSIANSIGIDPIHLARVFKLHYGCTIGEYVRKLRIEFACREISLTATPLTEIAVAAGFYDQSHFSRTFKRIVGLTPSEYCVAFRPR